MPKCDIMTIPREITKDTPLKKYGTSYMVPIDKEIREALNVSEGDWVTITISRKE